MTGVRNILILMPTGGDPERSSLQLDALKEVIPTTMQGVQVRALRPDCVRYAYAELHSALTCLRKSVEDCPITPGGSLLPARFLRVQAAAKELRHHLTSIMEA